MASRAEVYSAIDSERAYQEELWGGHRHEAESWTLFLQHYVNLATIKASTTDFTEEGKLTAYLSDLRKIATLAVAAMEQHGAPRREGF